MIKVIEYYYYDSKCHNCGHSQKIKIRKGKLRNETVESTKCDNCGCESLN